MNFPTLYHKGRAGKLYSWRVWTEGESVKTEIRDCGWRQAVRGLPGNRQEHRQVKRDHRIWRMQGPDGKGPFRGNYFAYKTGSCAHIPTPFSSHGYLVDDYEIFGTEGKYLCEWFLPSIDLLNRSRQKLIKLAIPKKNVKFFEKQVIFRRKDARVVRKYPPSHILKFRKQKSRKAGTT